MCDRKLITGRKVKIKGGGSHDGNQRYYERTGRMTGEIVKDSNLLSEMISKINETIGSVAKKAGLEFSSEDFFYDGDDVIDPKEYLAIKRTKPDIFEIVVEGPNGNGSFDLANQTSREEKVAFVKSFPSFIKEYVEFLKDKNGEYKEAAEIAEKINNVLTKRPITFRLIEDGIKVAIFLDRPVNKHNDVEAGYSSLDSEGTPGVFPESLLKELQEVEGQYILKAGESFHKVI